MEKVFDWHSVGFCQPPYSSTVTNRATGQMAQYMHDLKVKHAFLTTYDETIFLRQALVNGRWTLEYSPIIQHSDSALNGQVTLRQCFLHLALEAMRDRDFDTGGLRSPWTVSHWTRTTR